MKKLVVVGLTGLIVGIIGGALGGYYYEKEKAREDLFIVKDFFQSGILVLNYEAEVLSQIYTARSFSKTNPNDELAPLYDKTMKSLIDNLLYISEVIGLDCYSRNEDGTITMVQKEDGTTEPLKILPKKK